MTAPAAQPDPHAPLVANCGCETSPGIVADGPDAWRDLAAFEADHQGADCHPVHRKLDDMGHEATAAEVWR